MATPEQIAALERAAELLVNGGSRCQQDAALIRAVIERKRSGGERAKVVALEAEVARLKRKLAIADPEQPYPVDLLPTAGKSISLLEAATMAAREFDPVASGAHEEQQPVQDDTPLIRCQAARDGECIHRLCPQLRDNEPYATGRHCPIDIRSEDD